MIEDFINYLVTLKGYSVNTAEAYRRDLYDFAAWARSNLADARWSVITRTDIDNYIQYCVDSDLKPATTNRRLASISGLYRFFKRQGHDIENPCKYESRRKIADTIPNTIPMAELQEAYNHAMGATKIMLGLLATTGIRIQELLDLRYEDIDFEKASIKVRGKGNKERLLYTSPNHLDTLRLAHLNGASGIIFNLTQRDARRMIWESLKPYSHAPQLSPHAIRHTFATNQAANGTNCSTLAEMLGHKDLNTTQKYIDIGQSNIKQACLAYSLLH